MMAARTADMRADKMAEKKAEVMVGMRDSRLVDS